MKNLKIAICVIIFLFIIVLIFVRLDYVSKQYEIYSGEIYKKENNIIFIESNVVKSASFLLENALFYDINKDIIDISELDKGDSIYVDEKGKFNKAIVEQIDNQFITVNIQQKYYYSCSVDNVIIISKKWTKNNIDKLNIGDTIEIINKRDFIAKTPVGNNALNLSDVKIIKVLKYN